VKRLFTCLHWATYIVFFNRTSPFALALCVPPPPIGAKLERGEEGFSLSQEPVERCRDSRITERPRSAFQIRRDPPPFLR